MTRTSYARISVAFGLVFAATTLAASSYSPRFLNDDPLQVEPETQDASGVQPDEVNLFVDLTANLVRGMRTVAAPPRAGNVNTIGEVPDSSWYTNRVGLTPERVAIGPNTTDGPGAGTWTVSSSKSDGVTPGFTITDPAGVRWFLKFDPRGHRGMSTGTEVTVTKLMWALGYNVPENHIAYLRREQLAIGAAARFTAPNGRKRPLRDDDIDALLAEVGQEPDGSYRVVASKALAGKPVGRIRFAGTRPDDPNDVVPHEHRRELRGYGVFAAWLNHVDAKAINSLDTLVTENGRTFVRHHLLDFGSALGSGGVAAAEYRAGSEYLLEPNLVGRQLIGFGFSRQPWQSQEFFEAPAIGRLQEDNGDFDPDLWKPRVPNQAFLHARDDDRFWAARKLAGISTDMLRAAVAAGEFGDPSAEEFLVGALAERRDAILRAYLPAVNPIVDLALNEAGLLTFANAAVEADIARAPQEYRAAWFAFDNSTGVSTPLAITSARTPAIHAPGALTQTNGSYVKVSLSAAGALNPAWEVSLDAYFLRADGHWRLIALDRLPE